MAELGQRLSVVHPVVGVPLAGVLDARSEADAMIRHRGLLGETLEICRAEVVRRLQAKQLPLTIKIQQMVVVNNPDGTGWGSDWEEVQVSPLRSTEILIAVRDESIPHLLLGLADQLRPLAERLDTTTDLGGRGANFLPALTGVDAILARYLAPLAMHYLQQLRSVRTPRPSLVDLLAAELDLLCDASRVVHSSQLSLKGVMVRRAMTHRGITLRPLSPSERGAVLEGQQASWSPSLADTGEFVVPRRFGSFAPAVLLDMQTTRSREQPQDESRLAYRVALAFFLSGFDISSTGILVGFDRPRLAAFGMSQAPFPVSEKVGAQDRLVSPTEFRAIVDLAHQIPKFGEAEGSGRDVVLFRVLRGCGMQWQESGFLDFAIALEAALLGGIENELAHRFRLYGALYLGQERDPLGTFNKLRNIYNVRSKLVHGGRVKADDRAAAEHDAADLAKTVTRKAVLDGWPDRSVLDEAALRVHPRGRRPS